MGAPRIPRAAAAVIVPSYILTIRGGGISSSYGHKNERGRDPRRQSSASWNNRNASTSNSVIDNGWGPPKIHASQNDKPGWDTFKSPLGRRASSSSDNGWGPPMKQHQNGKRDVDPWPRRSSDGPGDSKGMGKDTYKDATSGWRAAESSEGWGSIHGAVSRWGDSDGTGGSGDGWGSNATTPTAAVVSGWGESSKTYKTTDSGWSESSKSMSASSSGWGEPSKTGTPISGGGAAPADSGTGATREANPRTSSGWVLEAAKEEGTRRESGWRTGTSDWDTRSKPSDPIFPPISHSASRATDINKAPPLAPRQMTPTLPAKKEKVPLPGRKTSSTIVTQQVIDQRNSPLERSLKINTNIIELEESMPSGTSTSARSAWTRDKIQKSTFQYMLQAVRYQIDLGVALADIERWKRLRSSAQFVRATPATQTVLQDQRLVYGKTSDTVETRLKTTIKYLSEIPQVSARADLISAETGKREMIHYIAQLRDWIGTVKVLYPNTPPEPEIEPETLIPATTVKRSKHPKELIWDQVDTLVNLVNDHIDDIYDLLEGREKRETPQDIESKFIALLKAHDMKQLAEAEAKSSGLLSELNQVGLDFKEVADETAELITTSFDQGKIVETLKTELEECETAKNQVSTD
ncbi:hypothetical protein H0H87_012403 [Tephrocybe sp. NHM501043]|nr:hypothetical protein H0H87_012403 [Tephrocybe sp. NHM501043]